MPKVRDLTYIDVAEVMRPCPCVVQPETDVAEAARVMLRQNTDRAVVMDEGEVVGILALTDALTGILETTDERWG